MLLPHQNSGPFLASLQTWTGEGLTWRDSKLRRDARLVARPLGNPCRSHLRQIPADTARPRARPKQWYDFTETHFSGWPQGGSIHPAPSAGAGAVARHLASNHQPAWGGAALAAPASPAAILLRWSTNELGRLAPVAATTDHGTLMFLRPVSGLAAAHPGCSLDYPAQ